MAADEEIGSPFSVTHSDPSAHHLIAGTTLHFLLTLKCISEGERLLEDVHVLKIVCM